jgi:hypothetical protein
VVGGNAAFYTILSILAKKYLAIPVSYVPNIFLGTRVSEEKNF